MLRVVYSTSDEASMNIRKFLKKSESYEIVETNDSLNYSDSSAGMNFFVSKHASVKNIKSLTCHTPGNFGTAEYGGTSGVLSVSNAKIQSECLRLLNSLNERNQWGFQVALEVTHHGPSLNNPCLFIELGSSAEQWNQDRYCSGIAAVTTELINNYEKIMKRNQVIAIGIGGSHYAPSFTHEVLKNGTSIGHICPDYALKHLNKELFHQMILKTVPEPKLVLFHKGVKSEDRKIIINWCDDYKLEYKRLR